MNASHFSRLHSLVGIEKSEIKIHIKKDSTCPPIKRTQFHLALAWASTAHTVQGLSLDMVTPLKYVAELFHPQKFF